VPKYVYFCKKCEEAFEARHSLQEICTICKLCDTEGQLQRRPSAIFISKKISNLSSKSKPGEIIRTTIEESKQELQQEQKKLKNRDFNDVE